MAAAPGKIGSPCRGSACAASGFGDYAVGSRAAPTRIAIRLGERGGRFEAAPDACAGTQRSLKGKTGRDAIDQSFDVLGHAVAHTAVPFEPGEALGDPRLQLLAVLLAPIA